MHMFEMVRPNRDFEKLENELSEDLKKILKKRKDEAEGLVALDEAGINFVTGFVKVYSKVKP